MPLQIRTGSLAVVHLLVVAVPWTACSADGRQEGTPGGVTSEGCILELGQVESDWRVQERLMRAGSPREDLGSRAVRESLRRGFKLAEALEGLGVDVAVHRRAMEEVAGSLSGLSRDATAETYRAFYGRARGAVRKLAFTNPLLDFDDLLFVKRVPGSYAHMSDQFLGWFSRPGGGLFVLRGFRGDRRRLDCLTASLPAGSVLSPDLSYDGRRALFSYCRHDPGLAERPDKMDKASIPEDAFYHLYEVGLDGKGLRRLTGGKYDDLDGRYLPDGRIVFVSTRRGQFLQCTEASAAETLHADLPDSYMRCGGGRERPVAVYTLHVMDGDGQRLQAISPAESFEWHPAVAHDGRIIYSRWDYVDRNNLPYIGLWSTSPDGSASQAVFGNFTANPLALMEPRAVPGSNRLVCTASAHHSITGGSLVLLDPRRGVDAADAMNRLTPQVRFPESEGWPDHYYANPYPLSEDYFLVAWSNQRLVPEREQPQGVNNPPNALGLYLFDRFGNLDLIYRDEAISSMYPIPVRPRAIPPRLAGPRNLREREEGRLLLLNIYEGLDGAAAGSVRRLRIVGVPPKIQPVTNFPQLGVTEDDAGKFVLGTVPVEKDGSAYFRVPAGVPFFFQALGRDGMAVQTMRSVTYVPAGRTYTCIGCHEHRTSAPANKRTMAAERKPSRITPGPDGSWPFDFTKLVQPLLDKHCVRCHQPGADGGLVNLTPGNSYLSLVSYGHESTPQSLVLNRYEAGFSKAGQGVASSSELVRLLQKKHYDVQLDTDEMERLVTWLDIYAQRSGSFGREQEDQLRQLRRQLLPLLSDTDAQ